MSIAVAKPKPRSLLSGVYLVPLVLLFLALPVLIAPYQTQLLTYGLIFGIVALGFNLLLGQTGLLSFGHSAYFGAAAYAAAFTVKYLGVTSMEVFLLLGVLSSLVAAAVFGFVCVRYTRIFFSILTLALSQVLWSLAFKFYAISGGSDGLRVPTPSLLGGLLPTPEDKMTFLARDYYYYVLVIFVACVAVLWLIVNSPFGKALQAIRDNEVRAEFVGVPVKRFRWIAFVISGGFAGIAGALWAPLVGQITPEVLHWTFSGEIVFMTVLGGFKNFAGPIVGAVVFNYLKEFVVAHSEYWQFFLGATLMVLILLLPEGIVGPFVRIGRRLRPGR